MTNKKRVKQGFFSTLVGFPLFVVMMGIPGIVVLSSSYVALEYGNKVCDALDEFVSYKRYGTPQVKPTNVVRVRNDEDEPKMCMPEGPARELMDEPKAPPQKVAAKADVKT